MQIRRPKALVACSGVPPGSNLAVELVEHRLDVRHAQSPGNVLPQSAQLARGELIAACDAPLTRVGTGFMHARNQEAYAVRDLFLHIPGDVRNLAGAPSAGVRDQTHFQPHGNNL
jgi:hypothetical protein